MPNRCTDKIAIAAALIAIGVLGACAKKGPPSGGPPDTTPPLILSSEPATGSTNVPRDVALRIAFSEGIARVGFEAQVLVTPRPTAPLTFKWSKHAVELHWPDSLHPNTTYRITLGPKIKDHHAQEMGQPHTVTFSTGTVIDSGTIAGTAVALDGKPVGDIEVRAYRLPADTVGGAFAFMARPAEYATLSGADGRYLFEYMPPGSYRVIALDDKNRNDRRDHSEQFGIGAFDAAPDGADGDTTDLDLYVRLEDTAVVAIRRCHTEPSGILQVTVTQPLDDAAWRALDWMIAPDEHPTDTIVAHPLVPPDAIMQGTSLDLLTPPLGPGGRYTLLADIDRDDIARLDTLADRCEFFMTTVPDTLGPEITGTKPTAGAIDVPLTSYLQVGFSEPLADVNDSILTVADSLGNTISGAIAMADARTVRFTPTGGWPPNRAFIVAFDSAFAVDRAGNTMPEATQPWTFRTQNPDEFGGFAGSVSATDNGYIGASCILSFRAGRQSPPRDTMLTIPRNYEIALPAGQYVVRAVLDLDRDGRFTPGALSPFRFAEPRLPDSDTVEVRARFVTEGVDVVFPHPEQ